MMRPLSWFSRNRNISNYSRMLSAMEDIWIGNYKCTEKVHSTNAGDAELGEVPKAGDN